MTIVLFTDVDYFSRKNYDRVQFDNLLDDINKEYDVELRTRDTGRTLYIFVEKKGQEVWLKNEIWAIEEFMERLTSL